MSNLIEYSINYSKTSRSLWQYYRDEPFLYDNGTFCDFPSDKNNSALFEFKTNTTGKIDNGGTKIVRIMVPSKYLSNFWRIRKKPLINCEITLIITWSANCFIIGNPVNNQVPKFEITDTNLFVPVVTLSTQDNAKLLQQLKAGLKRTIN